MQPVLVPLTLVQGDTFDLTVNLFSSDGADRHPLEVAPGEAFVLTLSWPTRSLVATTSSDLPTRLAIEETGELTRLSRQLSIAETGRLPIGPGVIWSLARAPSAGIRRTYVTGPVTVLGPGQGGPGDTMLDVTVRDGSVTVDIGVPDSASYADARDAILRADMLAAIDDAERTALAAALFFGN